MDATQQVNEIVLRSYSRRMRWLGCVAAVASCLSWGGNVLADESDFAQMLKQTEPRSSSVDSLKLLRGDDARILVVPVANDTAIQLPPSAFRQTSLASMIAEEDTLDLIGTDGDETDDQTEADKPPLEDEKDEKLPQPKRNLMDQRESQGRKPEVVNGRFELPTIAAATTATADIGNGRTPAGFRADTAEPLAPLAESGIEREGNWTWAMRTWAAPNTFSYPRYFEDRMLERHGHERCPHWTPILAGVRFFGTVPLLPYLATVQHPCDCEYTLGYYRTGSCVPAYLQRPPYERKAVVAEAVAITAGTLIIP
ncbi:hypothetical protein Poly41_15290 [Novipirellula artificiosorum]|uniref:Uncharacterized protein n=2 Tax=Novipirellula artificiosorum TaxID=2528016 RepID=A0A5C6DWV8_9BACT|nr:hypothetical protein Poly41_15290 [Novipirellula artificiosorum]